MVLKVDHEISRSHLQFVYKDFIQDLSLKYSLIILRKSPFDRLLYVHNSTVM